MSIKMKNIFKFSLILAIAGAFLFSCAPLDKDDYKLGDPVNESALSFTASPSASTPNIIVLKNTSTAAGVALWDLGNGSNAKGDEVSVSYPFKGDYTVSMSLYTPGGSATISKVISIADDDYDLLDTPGFNALTGGANAVDGKTWVFAKYTNGHFGVGDINAAPEVTGPAWWQCPPSGKDGCSLYENEYTFIQKGTKLIWKNNGNIYTNENGMNHLGIPGTPNAAVGDFDVLGVGRITFERRRVDEGGIQHHVGVGARQSFGADPDVDQTGDASAQPLQPRLDPRLDRDLAHGGIHIAALHKKLSGGGDDHILK